MPRWRRELPEVRATAESLPTLVRDGVEEVRERVLELERRIADYDHRIEQLATQHDVVRRLMQGEGVGPISAPAGVATSGAGHACAHGRQFAAGGGLVPQQQSSGGKPVLGRITKPGTVYLRTLLIPGARAVVQGRATRRDQKSRGVEAVRQRRGNKSAAGALAAKHARMLWALLAHGQEYQLAA